ncbi:MAG: O-antigen ligase family protein [Blastocatellia bacterium]|nr:O-antigen ligase family protein [Blastocatellia bacterium]
MTLSGKIVFVLIFAIAVFSVIAYGGVHQPVVAFVYILIALLAILWAVDGLASGEFRYSTSLLQVPVLGAAIYGLIQIIPFGSIAEVAGVADIPRTISIDPFATRVSSLHLFGLFIFFAIALTVFTTAARLRKMAAAMTIFGFVYAFFAILQSVLSPDLIYGIYDAGLAEPFGSFVNRNNFAAIMEMTIPIPLGLLFVGAIAKDKRLLYITAIALMGVALVLSGSRGGLVAMFAQIVLLVLMTAEFKKGRALAVKLALSVLLVGAIVGGSMFVGGESSLTRIAESGQTEDVTTNRGHIWSVTLRTIADSMPFGTGLGAYAVAYTRHDTYSGMERVEQAHNDYLQVVSDAGVPGLLLGGLFLFLLVRLGRQAIQVENVYRRGVALGAFAGCFAILVHSIFDFVLHTTAVAVMFLMLIAILVAALRRYEDDLVNPDSHRQKQRRRPSSSAPVATFKR